MNRRPTLKPSRLTNKESREASTEDASHLRKVKGPSQGVIPKTWAEGIALVLVGTLQDMDALAGGAGGGNLHGHLAEVGSGR